jgi:DnaJ-class molecular chaperone
VSTKSTGGASNAQSTQTGSIFRIKGKGIVSLQGPGRGDLFVVASIVTPTRLTREQRRMLEQFAQLKENQRGQARSLSSFVLEQLFVSATFCSARMA